MPSASDIPALDARLTALSAGDRLRWAAETFGSRAGIGTSFQPAGIVILHLAKSLGLNLPAFTLNTGLLFPETLELKAQLEKHLGITIEDLQPAQTVAEQAVTHGPELWKRDPEKCCGLRKVAVLDQKLFALDLWITGVRRDQSQERSVTPLVSLVARPDHTELVKLNPLVDWSREQVWDYIRSHQIPYNVLHDRGFRSIGCAPCTALPTSDDERSGRWVGFNKTECGLHNRPRPQ